mgnify:FL=1
MELIDLTGKRIGKLNVIKRAENKGRRTMWLCKCDCGNMKIIPADNLLKKHKPTISCGCACKTAYHPPRDNPIKNIKGMKFGRLTVIEFYKKINHVAYWKCRCNCGNEIIASGILLRNGSVKSCGCYKKDLGRKQLTKHGMCSSRIAIIWYRMKERCYCITNSSYKNYGGRGIKICDEWLNSFESFYDWAMKNGYKDNLSIDRIDNNGDYCPENCRWATRLQQSRNRRSNIHVEYNGIEYSTLTELCDVLGIPYKTLYSRKKNGTLYRYGIKIKEI